MDVVYILGKGSRWDNNEIRYSLRSVEKFLKNFNKIFIVGECPPWIQNVTHIRCGEYSQIALFKERNIMEKLRVASSNKEITDDFFSMQDDYFFLQSVSVIDFPFYHRGPLINAFEKRATTDTYRTTLENTHYALIRRDLPALHYDIHVPIIYNKNSFRLSMAKYDWNESFGYGVKSLYANTINVTGKQMVDCKIDRKLNEHEISIKTRERFIFSVGDAGLHKPMRIFLEDMFPEKSMFEK